MRCNTGCYPKTDRIHHLFFGYMCLKKTIRSLKEWVNQTGVLKKKIQMLHLESILTDIGTDDTLFGVIVTSDFITTDINEIAIGFCQGFCQ